MTRGELRRRMSSTEFTDWRAYYRFEAKYQELEAEKAARRSNKRGR